MDDIESAPLVAKTAPVTAKKSSTMYTLLAVAVLVTLSLIAVCVPSVKLHAFSTTNVINFEVMASEKENGIFTLADTDKDNKVSKDEVRIF